MVYEIKFLNIAFKTSWLLNKINLICHKAINGEHLAIIKLITIVMVC